MRFDNIKNQYQHELIPLTERREAILREIAELKASRSGPICRDGTWWARRVAFGPLQVRSFLYHHPNRRRAAPDVYLAIAASPNTPSEHAHAFYFSL